MATFLSRSCVLLTKVPWTTTTTTPRNNSVQHVGRRNLANLLDRAKALRQQAVERERREIAIADPSQSRKNGVDPIDAVFDEIDTNHDGVLTRDEFRIAVEKLRTLDLSQMKQQLRSNDISLHQGAGRVLGQKVLVADDHISSWKFMKNLPDYSYVQDLCPSVALPEKSHDVPPITLLLDMDETILHSSVEDPSPDNPPHHTFNVSHQGSTFAVHTWLRPQLEEFLEKIRGKFEVVIFTASESAYANRVLDLIDPHGEHFHHRLFRESCITVDGNHLKDLKVVGRDLSKVILVDNSPHVFGYHVSNGIPIVSWFETNRTDNELEKLEWFLRDLLANMERDHVHVDMWDVRPYLEAKFQVKKLIDEACSSNANQLHS
jgi:CTD small phosphatase-like protein 2